VWANDADPEPLGLLQANLAPLRLRLPHSVAGQHTHGQGNWLADCLIRETLSSWSISMPSAARGACCPWALDAVSFGGVPLVASSDGRSPTATTGPPRIRAAGRLPPGPSSQLGVGPCACSGVMPHGPWAMGRGLEPRELSVRGRTFRTAVRCGAGLPRRRRGQLGRTALLPPAAGTSGAAADQPARLGAMLRLPIGPVAVSGPFWIGPLQHGPTLTPWPQSIPLGPRKPPVASPAWPTDEAPLPAPLLAPRDRQATGRWAPDTGPRL